MAETLSHDEFWRHVLRERQKNSPTGIGAWPDEEITKNDEDGRTWQLKAYDGRDEAWVEASWARWDEVEIKDTQLATIVERRAGEFPVETRLADLSEKRLILGDADFD
jgi:hypothetical protein